jgi:hypothetical protein
MRDHLVLAQKAQESEEANDSDNASSNGSSWRA